MYFFGLDDLCLLFFIKMTKGSKFLVNDFALSSGLNLVKMVVITPSVSKL